jgi:hypothetical protein
LNRDRAERGPGIVDYVRLRCWIDPHTGCWHWRGGRNSSGKAGIPVIAVREGESKKTLSARRLILDGLGRGPRKGEATQPTCGEYLCLNPAHLKCISRAKIAAESVRKADRFNPRRIAAARARPHVKLDMETARRIRARYAELGNAKLVADEFGLGHQHCWAVCVGRLWREPPLFG